MTPCGVSMVMVCSLSSSLLDYAGVLGTTLVEFDDSVLNSSPINSPINGVVSLNKR